MGRAQVLFGFTSLKPLFAGNFLLGARGAVAHARSLFPPLIPTALSWRACIRRHQNPALPRMNLESTRAKKSRSVSEIRQTSLPMCTNEFAVRAHACVALYWNYGYISESHRGLIISWVEILCQLYLRITSGFRSFSNRWFAPMPASRIAFTLWSRPELQRTWPFCDECCPPFRPFLE